jgi:tetratricopeptide (TPR) repeat protein
VVILEDLQWADEMSVRLLSFVARRLEALAVIIVTTVRIEESSDVPLFDRLVTSLVREHRLVRVTLGVLSREHTLELLHALGDLPTATRAAVTRLGEQVWAIGHGHPFMTVEAVRALQQGAVIAPQTHGLALPRVDDLIPGRLGRLRPVSRQLASVAAVAGRPCAFGLLTAAAGIGQLEAAIAVEELVRRRVLKAVESDFDFTHERIRDVAYVDLLPPLRKALHGALARAIETLYADDSSRTGACSACITATPRAGRRPPAASVAPGRTRPDGARIARLCVATSRRWRARSLARDAGAARTESGPPLRPQKFADAPGRRGGLTGRLREAEAIANALGDRRRLGWVSSFMAFHESLGGDLPRAVEAGRRAAAIATDVGDSRLEVHANYCLGVAYYSLGDYRRAAEVARKTIGSLTGDRLRESAGGATLPSVLCRAYLALSLAELGEFDEAAAAAEEARRLAADLGHRYSAAAAAFGVGMVELRRGEPETAVEAFAEGLELCLAGEFAVLEPYLTSALGIAYASSGKIDEGLPLLHAAVEQAHTRNLKLRYARHLVWLAEGCLLAAQPGEARERAEHALLVARERGERGIEAWALRLLGEISAREPGAEATATTYLAEALTLAQQAGMRPLEAACLARWGDIPSSRAAHGREASGSPPGRASASRGRRPST